ncbi:MAG: choice-of-anchor L domain-containing protein [Actinomyces sp.]|uniref:choice-of-anchor L domain-containing protein n=1 Tax=Actinomyces sp. TaxID=29317 RepID=UPI0026DD0D4C|nr:choice-of-anchor L domain-containing protein [Actinomyces sp.]MDO4242395.1 choice-of-anchor L domain-containing protein [Actinomyces sp.]
MTTTTLPLTRQPARRLRVARPLAALAAALCLGIAAAPASASTQATDSLRNSELSAQSLAESIAGPGVTVANATFSGDSVQAGTFSGLPGDGNAVTQGVALTTGSLIDADPQADSDVDFSISSVLGPNDKLTTTGDLGGAGDEALGTLSGEDTYDAAVLEFDVTATDSNFVLFYGFGSEEYAGGSSVNPDAWQSRGYKDVLSIQVNGTECAYVPGTQTSVNAATVNDTTNTGYFTSNVSGHSPGSIDVEFNGFTSAMACQAAVTAGETVHVRVAIADTLDGQLDSTVLLSTQGLGFLSAPITDPCTTTGGTCSLPGTGADLSTDPSTDPGDDTSASPGSGADDGTATATVLDARATASPKVTQVSASSSNGSLARTGAHALAWSLGALGLLGAGGVLLLARRRRQG